MNQKHMDVINLVLFVAMLGAGAVEMYRGDHATGWALLGVATGHLLPAPWRKA